MAQNITLLGASYTAVPGVQLPKTGGGTALFTDVTPTTATASDVATGKVFFDAVGTQTTGTGSSGSFTPQLQVIRPDAELIETWSRDFHIVEDDGLTIPSYSTTATTLKATTTLDTYDGVPLEYNYYVTVRTLTIPEYDVETTAKGRQEYSFSSALYEWVYTPSGEIQTINGAKTYGQYSQFLSGAVENRHVYWSSTTAISPYKSVSYGVGQSVTVPAVASNKTITIKSPTVTIRGSTTYFTSTFYNALTDVRCQYIIELWRVPITAVRGWGHGSADKHILECVRSSSHTLT